MWCYTDANSYLPSERVKFHCSTTADKYSIEISRMGGKDQRVWRRDNIPGEHCETPANASSHGCGWPVAFDLQIPADWPSGYYSVIMRAESSDGGAPLEHEHFFVVRSGKPANRRDASILVVLATATYQAYNPWGGFSIYTGADGNSVGITTMGGTPVTRVSSQRPWSRGFLRKPADAERLGYAQPLPLGEKPHMPWQKWAVENGYNGWTAPAGWWNFEYPFVQWAEENGYGLDYAVSSDLELHPEVVDGYKLVLSIGHDEYWSWGMRDTIENYIANGGNVGFFSGNLCVWQVRYEDNGQTMVCYSYRYEKDPVFKQQDKSRLTSLWSDLAVGRPENEMSGVSAIWAGFARMTTNAPRGSGGYTIWRPDHWVFDGAEIYYGDVIGTKDAVVSYEVDGCELTMIDGLPVPTHRDGTPEGFVVLGTAPASNGAGGLKRTLRGTSGDRESKVQGGYCIGHAVMGTFTRGGTVFSCGTTNWCWGIKGRDPQIVRITRNVLNRLSA